MTAAKPLALLIPGLDGTGLLYYRQIERLSQKYRVTPWAFRAGGRFGFRELVDELAEETAHEAAHSVVVVGESFGGPVAMHFALAYPGRIRNLVLINTFARHRWRVRTYLACRFAPFLRAQPIAAVKNAVVDRLLTREGIPAEDRSRYHEIVRCVCHQAYCRRLELVRESDLINRLQDISAPTLLFASGCDKIVPSVAEARLMASRIPRATVREFPKAGHALLLTPGFYLADYL